MFLRHSNAKLQEELRDTMRSYVEEKSVLRAHLANLRLDLTELHCDNRTVTTETSGEGGGGGEGEDDDTASKYSMGSDAELRALMDEPAGGEKQGDSTMLHLPAIKHRGRKGGRGGGGGGGNSGESSNRSNKMLRFCGSVNTPHVTSVRLPADTADGPETLVSRHKSFFDSSVDSLDKQEHQKFSELQRHREALRNQGRVALRDRKASLIRLPTITSAKRRTSIWDSGQYVSRPKGKSTEFESFPYMEASLELSRTNLKIPKIKDPHRTETQRRDVRHGSEANRKRVQFTRPRLEPIASEREKSDKRSVLSGDAAAAAAAAVAGLLGVGDGDGADSLNSTLVDTTLDTTFGGNVSFDEEYFKNLAAQTKARANNNNNNNNKQNVKADKSANTSTSNTLNTTTTTNENKNNITHPTTSKSTSLSTTMVTSSDAADASIAGSSTAEAEAETDRTSGPTPDPRDPPTVPPLRLQPLARKNVRLHELQLRQSRLARVSPLTGGVQKATTSDRRSPGEKSLKSSDRSVATKISRLSQVNARAVVLFK